MTKSPTRQTPAPFASAVALLTPRRLRAQAFVLALCLWGVCAIDFATPSLFDRVGNIKFQDFLPLYASARLIIQNRAIELYDPQAIAGQIHSVIGQSTHTQLPNLYGPQVALFFVPFAKLSFPAAAWTWAALSLLIFFTCIFLVWKHCPSLRPQSGMVILGALAFPPLFHFFVRGQISVLPLACFSAAYLAFRVQRDWLAGVALGFLVLKPQFLVAIPLVLLLSRSWICLSTLVLSAATQLAFTRLYFGAAVMRSYVHMLLKMPRWISTAELSLAPIQMHSLRSFWSLLIPWPTAASALYLLTSCIAIAIAAAIWKSSRPLALRFSALSLAAVLVNPHLFIYDLLMLAPALLLLADWSLRHASSALPLLLYLAFVLPLLGPFSQYTHLQLTVPVFAALLWTLSKTDSLPTNPCPLFSNKTRGHKCEPNLIPPNPALYNPSSHREPYANP